MSTCPGMGNLPDVDPLFCDAPTDLNICEDSQCIIFNPNDLVTLMVSHGRIMVGCGECGQHEPGNLTITDRPNDQGSYVLVSFTASYFDTSVPDNLRDTEFYQLWMRVADSDDWIAVNTAGAIGAGDYVMLGSTPQDSTSVILRSLSSR